MPTQKPASKEGSEDSSRESKAIPFEPKTRADTLALEIAREFADEPHLPAYRSICATHDETLVRRAFSHVKAMPENKIKKSRRALFIHIVKQNAQFEE